MEDSLAHRTAPRPGLIRALNVFPQPDDSRDNGNADERHDQSRIRTKERDQHQRHTAAQWQRRLLLLAVNREPHPDSAPHERGNHRCRIPH